MAGEPWKQYEVEAERTWGDVATEGLGNLPMSLYGVAEDVVTAVANPVETGKAILNLASGMMQKALPDSVNKRLDFDPNNEKLATAVFEFYANKYGSEKEIKKAIAEDPASVLADLSTFLTGAGAVVTTTGKVAKMSKLSGAQKAVDIGKRTMALGAKADPLALTATSTIGATNLAGRAVEEISGVASGVGTAPLEEARKVGQTSPFGRPKSEEQKTFEENIKGDADSGDILNTAKNALGQMRRTASENYRRDSQRLSTDKTELSFNDIDMAVKDAEKFGGFKGQTINQKAKSTLDDMKEYIDNWKKLDPAEFHTPEGMDKLKQALQAFEENIPMENRQARAVASSIRNSVKKTIIKQAPLYERMMRNYEETQKLIKEIEKALSLGNKTQAETGIRKLQSVMRNNVNTGYGTRTDYVKTLEQASGENIMPAIAGQTLSTPAPRGVSRMTALPTIGGAGLVDPTMALPATVVSSPRVMGQLENVLGRVQGTMRNIRGKVPVSNEGITGLLNLMYQLEQQRQREEEFNQQIKLQP